MNNDDSRNQQNKFLKNKRYRSNTSNKDRCIAEFQRFENQVKELFNGVKIEIDLVKQKSIEKNYELKYSKNIKEFEDELRKIYSNILNNDMANKEVDLKLDKLKSNFNASFSAVLGLQGKISELLDEISLLQTDSNNMTSKKTESNVINQSCNGSCNGNKIYQSNHKSINSFDDLDLPQNNINNNNQTTYNKDDDFFQGIFNIIDRNYMKKCRACKRPFDSIKDWKKICVFCYAKKVGILVNCIECDKKTYVFKGPNYCLDCYTKHNGVEKTCPDCKKKYYITIKYDSSMLNKSCNDCRLKKEGIKIKCQGYSGHHCKEIVDIFKDEKEWRKQCYD